MASNILTHSFSPYRFCDHCGKHVNQCFEAPCDKNLLGPEPKPKPKINRIYVIGSLRNPKIPLVSSILRSEGYTVFDDWYAAGPEADDYWKKYEQEKGNTYTQALAGAAAKNVYAFDKRNLDASDAAILVLPAGKSGHLELGYMAGKGKKTFILMDEESDRWDVMYQFATAVCYSGTIASVLKEKL